MNRFMHSLVTFTQHQSVVLSDPDAGQAKLKGLLSPRQARILKRTLCSVQNTELEVQL
jgi:hypothetical protein